MLDLNQITTHLQAQNIPISGIPIKDKDAVNRFFVFVAISRDSENKQIPSNKKLNEIREQLADQSIAVEFLLADSKTRDIEAGLRATLLHSFGNDLRNVFLSLEQSAASVWLEPKRQPEEELMKAIKEKIRFFLQGFNMTIESVSLTINENLPGLLVSLRAIRQTAPVDLPTLSHELVRRGFTVPSQDWLRRRLDTMRKSGKIARLEDGRHVLTLSSLRELGTTKGRSSPDVQRMLALTRSR